MFALKRAYYTQVLFDYAVEFWGIISEILAPFFSLSPLVLRIRITNRCNLSCHFCYVGESLNQKSTDILQLSEWEKIIRNLPRHTLVDITGGEPFLVPRFEEIMDRLLERKLKTAIITNGTISKPEVLEKFVQKKLQYFMVSLDGDQKAHDKIRGEGSFNKTMHTLKQIIEYKKIHKTKYPTIVCKINLTEDNHPTLVELSDFLMNEIQVDGITLNLLFSNEARNGFPDANDFHEKKLWAGNLMKFRPHLIEAIAKTAEEIILKHKEKINVKPKIAKEDVVGYLKNPAAYSPSSCYKYRSVTTLYFDGKLTPCDLGLNVGNIREIDYNIKKLDSLLKLKNFFNMFKSHKRKIPGCAGCCLKTQVLTNEN